MPVVSWGPASSEKSRAQVPVSTKGGDGMKNSTRKGCWWPGPIILLLIVTLIGVPGCGETPAQRAAREQRQAEAAAQTAAIEAYVMAQVFVRRQLLAPATARFAPMREATVTNLGGGRWYIAAYVDAQNAFGAMIRTPFRATLRREGDIWHAESVKLIPR